MSIIGGIGQASGLPPNIVEQLMEVEAIPIHTLEDRKSRVQARLALVNQLDEKLRAIPDSLAGLANARGFTDIKVNSGDSNVITGSVDPEASVRGSWNVEVVNLAQKASAMSNGFPDRDKTQVGVGYIRIQTTEGMKKIYVSKENSTLDGVVRAVNDSGLGIRASVINDRADTKNPFKIMISGDAVGEGSMVKFPKVYMLGGDRDFYFQGNREAKNGLIKLDGFEIEVDDNTVQDIIPGLTLDLKQAAPGRTININVEEDREVVVGRVEEFVKSMNAVLGFIQQQNQLNEKSDTSRTLGGDQILRTIEFRLRNLLQSNVVGTESSVTGLSQLGITFSRSGVLELNQDRFNSELARAPDDVQRFLAGDGFNTGFVPRIRSAINNLIDGSFGPVSNRRRSLQSEIDRADQRIESLERGLESKEIMLRRRFANLEQTMSRMQGQGAMIQARLGGGS